MLVCMAALLRSSLGCFTSSSVLELNGDTAWLDVFRKLIRNFESELEVNNLYSALAIHAALYKIASVASDDGGFADDFRNYVCSAETESKLLNNELSHALDSHWNGSAPSRLMRLGLEILSDGWPSSLDDMAAVLSVLTPSGYTQDLRMYELQEMKSGSKVLEMMNKKVEEYLKHDSQVSLPSLYSALRACPAPGIEPGSHKLHITCRIIGNTSNLQLHGDCPVIQQKFCTSKDLRENPIDLEPIYQYVEALNLADDMHENDSEAKTTSAETRGMNTENSRNINTALVKLGDGEQSKECIELAKNCLENTQSPSKSIKHLPGKLEDYAYVIDCLVSPNYSDSHLVWEKGVPGAYIEYEKKMIEHNNLICRTGKWSNWLGELVITDTKAIMEYRQSAYRKSLNKRPKAARMIMTVLANVLVSDIQGKEQFCSHLLLLLSETTPWEDLDKIALQETSSFLFTNGFMDLAKKGSPCKDIKPFSIFSILQDNVPCDLHELLEATCDNSELFKILTSSGKKRKARRNSDDDATERPRKREKVGKIAGEDPLQSHSDVTQGREKVKPRRSSRHHVSKRLML